MNNSRVFGVAIALFLVTAVYGAQTKPAAKMAEPAAAAKASPESIANGETLYKRQCQMCHGATIKRKITRYSHRSSARNRILASR